MRAPLRLLAAALLITAAGQGVAAQDAPATPNAPVAAPSDLEAQTSAIASHLRCPVCQGVSVEDSPTELARQMRATVRDQLAAGRTPDQVRQYFVDRYGEWILLEPKASGFNLVVYVLPWLALIAGLTFIVLAVRRWTRPLPAEASSEASSVATTMDS